jgi:hypothetical protein
MEFIVSRNFLLPDGRRALSGRWWYNLWSRKLWPYAELSLGDTLFWYESKTGNVVWRSEVTKIVRFPYARKNEVARRLHLPRQETDRFYFKNASNSGFCLAYKVKPLERIHIPKPDDFRFPHQGWLRVTPELRVSWRLRKAKTSRQREEDRQPRFRATLAGSEKLTRISFNSAGWQRPTGDARKYESADTYNYKYGFGHEEWLFRSEWLIDGWRYAFIQGVNKSHSKLVKLGRPIDLTLFTIEPDKRRRYVAVINAVECLDDQQSRDALAVFKKNGWYETMRKEIKGVGGKESALGAARFAKHILNVRFRLQNVTFFPANKFANEADPITKFTRYQLYDVNGGKGARTARRGDRTLPYVRAWMRRGSGPVECTPEHAKMQAKLMKELKREYPRAQILREKEFVDVTVRTRNELILFEIKSDLEPRVVIRNGLGQILEYAYYPIRNHGLPIKMVIVGQQPLSAGDEHYLKRLQADFALPLEYRVISR